LDRGSNRGFPTLSSQTEIVPIIRMNPPSAKTAIVIGHISSGYVLQETTNRGIEVQTVTIEPVFD